MRIGSLLCEVATLFIQVMTGLLAIGLFKVFAYVVDPLRKAQKLIVPHLTLCVATTNRSLKKSKISGNSLLCS